jgi:glycogen debranching enzyme
MNELARRARQTLRANDRGGYTVPTARLYPFQWNWDSGFVAMGWAMFDRDRAWSEIEFLLRGQWEDGLIPQIVFHAPSDDYFPGPDVWRTNRTPPTSGITQPPVLATATREVLAQDLSGEGRAAEIYPCLVRNHRWWEQARDPERTGLAATLHPWETGMDNSPAWDAALARVPTWTETVIERRDTGHIDPSMRPRGEEYQRFIHLVEVFRSQGWNPAEMLEHAPFRVTDIGTNAILLRAEQDLLALAERFGNAVERAEIEARIARKRAAIGGLWNAEVGTFVSRDLIDGENIAIGTSAGFLPLFAGAASAEQAAAMARTLARWENAVPWIVPSTDPAHAAFEPLRYWRGPVWVVMNWMIANGFARAGQAEVADHILDRTVALIETSGLAEYFDPRTGHGLGGSDFSWTAAIYLMLSGSG